MRRFSVKEIQLSKGFVSIVDDGDFEILSRSRWHAARNKCGTYYARGWDGLKKVLMHRVIMGAIEGEIVDHKNGNTLDNRRENLRIVPIAINILNSKTYSSNKSGWRGVHWDKEKKKWTASLNFRLEGEPKKIFLGRFLTPEEAHAAYQREVFRRDGVQAGRLELST